MEKTTITYEGYSITASPRQLPDTDMWTVDLTISRGFGENRESWLISAGEQEEINEEGLEYCFTFGREIIDREMKE